MKARLRQIMVKMHSTRASIENVPKEKKEQHDLTLDNLKKWITGPAIHMSIT